MVRLAVSGYEVDMEDELIQTLGGSRNATPAIRRCWSVTTTDYSPLLLAELDLGLLIMSAPGLGADGNREALALAWGDIASIRQDEHVWRLQIVTVDGRYMRFLLSSLAELHSVAAELAGRCAESLGFGSPRGHADARDSEPEQDSQRAQDAQATADLPVAACARLPRPVSSARTRSRVRAHTAPSPTLDRIEQRLASMESLLAGLTGSTGREG